MNDDLIMGGHISSLFDQELDEVRSRVMKMGGLVESQIEMILSAIREDNSELLKDVSKIDDEVNRFEIEIDEECTQILAKRQPTAGDLRSVIATTKSVRDLERIGDEAERVARMVGHAIDNHVADVFLKGLLKLAEMVQKLLHSTLNTYARMETRSAIKNIRRDAEIDQEYGSIIVRLVKLMKSEPDNIAEALDVMWAARSLERIGDHCVNVCENVIYHVEGADVRHITIDQVKEQLS